MDYLSIVGIAIGLSMDAFAVSLTAGAVNPDIRAAKTCKIAGAFGLFQAFMPMIGWAVGAAFAGFIGAVDHFIAFILLGYIGGKMIYDSLKKDDNDFEVESRDMDNKTLLLMAVATSIDALVTGIILPTAVGASTLWLMIIAVSIIGIITFSLCAAAVYIGKKFGLLLKGKAEILGGAVLIAIGAKILIEHLFFQ
ncbi:MAG: manganese efflux pump [Clostridia bacterium]|nr:manganese efflux pump [Clostridia bacterium]